MAQVLVVDDETAVRGALTAHLQAMGHDCAEAGDGLEALERLHERTFDLVLTDVAMPHMNGLQFLARAMPYLADRVPVVLLSSVGDRGAITSALDIGAYDYLPKPAETEDVRRVVAGALHHRAELVRIHGRRRGRGGPVPADALGPEVRDLAEAAPEQLPAGVPAFRPKRPTVSVPRPAAPGHDASRGNLAPRLSWLSRLARVFRRPAA